MENIAEPPTRMDQGWQVREMEFLAQVAHVDIDNVAIGLTVRFVDVIPDQRSADDLARSPS